LAGATALAGGRSSGAFTTAHQRFWDGARQHLGDGPGTKALVGVLLLHRTLPAADVIAAMQAAVAMGNFDPDLVAVEARRVGLQATTPLAPVALPATAPPAAAHQRPIPSLAAYDQLLAGVGA
jgi:hypothetical protein